MLKVFSFNVEHCRCFTRIDKSSRNIIGSFDGRMVFHFDGAVRCNLGGEACAEKHGTSRLAISRAFHEPSPPIAFEFINVEFLKQSPLMNNADWFGKS